MNNSITQENFLGLERRIELAKRKLADAIDHEFANMLGHLSHYVETPEQRHERTEYELTEFLKEPVPEREISWANCNQFEKEYLLDD